MSTLLKKYLLPGLIFQSLMIGGGYVTGRELVEFFMTAGPLGGLAAMAVTTVIWSVVLAVSFEFARITRSFDYKTFGANLLGRWWISYEILYVLFVLVVLSVLGSASGLLLMQHFGLPESAGIIGLMAVIGILVLSGSKGIESAFTVWSFLLYATFAILLFQCWLAFGDRIVSNFAASTAGDDWLHAGVRYAAYNVAGVPAMLFCLRHIDSRKQALVAGLIAGPIGILPGVLLFIAMVGFYPQIQDASIPTSLLLDAIDNELLRLALVVIMFGTFIETGAGLLHGLNERLAQAYAARRRKMPQSMRLGVAIAILLLTSFIGKWVGIVELIGKGYFVLTYAFIAVFLVPVLTFGSYRIFKGWRRSGRLAVDEVE